MDELREIVELISEHGFTDFELENKEVRVRLRRELAPQIVSMPGTPSSQTEMQASGLGAGRHESVKTHTTEGSTPVPNVDAAVQSSQGEDEDLSMITSPIVGTFFRSPSPTADAFVGLGSQVNPDTVVCIIEAMKLMNEIQAETSGIVVKIYVENGQPVEYGQPLFGIKK